MGSKFSSGFTIIELMLFLAITGLLIAGILASAATSLNDQNYRDGVESTKNQISAQFAKVYSLTNGDMAANSENIDPCQVLEGNNSAMVQRGASNCLYVGRLVQVIPGTNSSTLRISPVIAKPTAANPSRIYSNQQTAAGNANESVNSLTQRYRIARYDANPELITDKEFDWGLAAVQPGTVRDQIEVAILVLRSPIDGTIQTYNLLATSPGSIDYANLGDRLTVNNLTDAKFCIADLNGNPTGSLDPPQRMAIIVHKAATGPGDIESRLNKQSGDPEC